MVNCIVSISIVLTFAIFGGQSFARTWIVEQDGTGDFFSIHDAMIACSVGDTIMIGPGRYDDFHPFTAPAWTTEVIIGVTKDNLTFIGSGNSTTIIGPTEMYLTGTVPEPKAIASVEDISAKFVDIRIENARDGMYWAFGQIEIVGCIIESCQNGVVLYCEDGAIISGLEFYSEESFPVGILSFSPCGPVTISECTFGGNGTNEMGIGINGTDNVFIQNCHFYTKNSILFSGSTGAVEGCTSTESVQQSVRAMGASQVNLVGNQLHGSYASIFVNGWSVVDGSGNIFSGGEDLATIFIASQSHVTLNNNDILKTGEYAAMIGQYFYEIVHNDLTNNYWGTSDPDSIAAWIWDYNDDPITRAYIDFIPFSGSSVPSEKKPFGSVKSMFR